MTESTYARVFTVPNVEISTAPRHSVVVRITHWLTTISFLGLVLSGIAILLAHPLPQNKYSVQLTAKSDTLSRTLLVSLTAP